MKSLPVYLSTLVLLLSCIRETGAQGSVEGIHSNYAMNPERVISLAQHWENSGTGHVVYEFSEEKAWEEEGKELILRLPAAKSPYQVIVNSFRFGTETAAGRPAEFSLSPFLREGRNSIALEARGTRVRWMSSCEKPVLLIREAIHISDVLIESRPGQDEGQCLLRINMQLSSFLESGHKKLEYTLLLEDPKGEQVFRERISHQAPLAYGQHTELVLDKEIMNTQYWSPGNPGLYRLSIRNSKTGKHADEIISASFGIRTASCKDSLCIINGDSLGLVPASPESLEVMLSGSCHEVAREVLKGGFNAIHCNKALPSHLVSLFEQEGILVIRPEGWNPLVLDRPHINSPCFVTAY